MLKEKALLKKRKAAHKAKSKREFGGARVLAGHPTRKNFMLSHTLLLLVQACLHPQHSPLLRTSAWSLAEWAGSIALR